MADLLDMVVIRANGEGIPIVFPVGQGGLAEVSAVRLSLRFQLRLDSIHVDEEIYECQSGAFTHTVGQIPASTGENTFWKLKAGNYRAYGIHNLQGSNSSDGVTFNRSSTLSYKTPPLIHVKVEGHFEKVTCLSSDSDVNSPEPPSDLETLPAVPTLQNLGASIEKPTEDLHVRSISGASVLHCLRGLRNLKGCRNALSKIDDDTIDIHSVTVLPPTFNGDVVFELSATDNLGPPSQAKQMVGMDKRYDGHVWSKTVTTNIINCHGLSFRTSICLGHLQCMNTECAFLSRVHRLKEVNELEWEGLSPTPLEVGRPHPVGSTLVCKICKEAPSCIARCNARVYYVGGNPKFTRAFVHLGIHEHPVKDGELRDMQEKTRTLIGE